MSPDPLRRHLQDYLGGWPPGEGLRVVTSPRRTEAGWDGQVRSVVGVSTPQGSVLSVAPGLLERLTGVTSLEQVSTRLGRGEGALFRGVYRWSVQPAALPDAGAWLPVDDPAVPDWLHPFGDEVLVALRGGAYAAGVGLKRHDRWCHEISVGTEQRHRGQGLAAALVAQATRRIVAEGRVASYLHAPDNEASARTAERAGFPDRGWSVHGLVGG